MRAPVILFAYNRPDHTARCLDALARDPLAIETTLHVYCDGPKNESARDAVVATRKKVRAAKGFAEIKITERESNLGLAQSVIRGVSEICRAYGRVIVLEDDLVTAPSFLQFMNDGLDRYADDEQVMQVAGFMFDAKLPPGEAVFLPFISSWGWATWDRAWRSFDPEMCGAEDLENDPNLRHRFNLDGHYDYAGMVQAQKQGVVDSWAICWNWSVFRRGGLVLYPSRSLVLNHGFDGSGTHSPRIRSSPASGLLENDAIRLPDIICETAMRDQIFTAIAGHTDGPPRSVLRRLIARILGN